VEEQTYKDGNYQESLKRAFLGTDEDILKSNAPEPSGLPLANRYIAGPDFVRDPSGCTAVVALVTEDDRIFVVRKTGFYPCFVAVTDSRYPTLLLPSFVGRVWVISIGQCR